MEEWQDGFSSGRPRIAVFKGGEPMEQGREEGEEEEETLEDILERDDGTVLPSSASELEQACSSQAAERASLLAQEEEEAIRRYTTFLECETEGFNALENLRSLLAQLQSATSQLTECRSHIKSLRDSSKQASSARQSVKSARELEPAVSELLDAPAIVEACAADGAYEDALAVEGLVSKLSLAHSGSSALASLHERVHASSQKLKQELLLKLQTNVQLPECLRVVGYLRRMHTMDEHELRKQFLHCREEFFQSSLLAKDMEESPYDYLKRITDSVRVHMFDIAMQYRAIFSEQTSRHSSPVASQADAPLFQWACMRIDWYIGQLRTHLPHIADSASFAYLLEHCRYCGQSLGRVGLDFRSLLPTHFEECMAQLFARSLANAVDALSTSLTSHTFGGAHYHTTSHHYAVHSKENNSNQHSQQPSTADSGPPQSLMAYPPVAMYINGVIAALNELRQCPLAALRSRSCALLEESLEYACDRMVQHYAFAPMAQSERAGFIAASKGLMNEGAKHVVRCLNKIFHGAGKQVQLQRACAKLQGVVTNLQDVDSEESKH